MEYVIIYMLECCRCIQVLSAELARGGPAGTAAPPQRERSSKGGVLLSGLVLERRGEIESPLDRHLSEPSLPQKHEVPCRGSANMGLGKGMTGLPKLSTAT